jgi:hypothetical protein
MAEVVETVEQKLKRHEDALIACMAEITKLREENARLRSEADAHTVLRSIYSDPDAPQTNRIKAAAASLAHEKPRLQPVPPPLDLVAEPVEDLATLVTKRRARQAALEQPYRLDGNQVVLIQGNGRNDGSGD